jgi:EAL domain-containing protein (putative c-di-GMP-specific phosphodiesterase class I)
MTSNRLLVIDDAAASSATIGRIARGCGFDTIITTDPDDFRSRVLNWIPTVIVMDLAMPQMSGRDLMAWLAQQGCRARILIVSGREPEQLLEAEAIGRSLGLNVAGSLKKPFGLEKLRAAFREIYDEAGMLSIQELSSALTNHEFHLEYQPQIDLKSGAVVGLEALARWNHPRRGAIPPSTFIPILEANGIMNDFTFHIFDLALNDMCKMSRCVDCRIATNVSAANFRPAGLDEVLLAKCINKGIDLNRITIEITESVAMQETGQVRDCLERLNQYGAQVSIDDFGTGFSSMANLRELPFSELKIDQSFVQDCLSNTQSRIMMPAIIDMAHNMRKRVVAEGVENQETMRQLSAWSCDIAQGYLIGRPMAFDKVEPWFQQYAPEHRMLDAAIE